MPSKESVEGLVALVEKGAFIEALESYYADGAATYENQGEARRGLAKLVELERGVMASFKNIRSRCVRPFFVDGDHAAIRWQVEFETAGGHVVKMDEISHQLWRDGKVVEERFFYDPAQTRPR
jgi:ketosteroid isomerase-like protein